MEYISEELHMYQSDNNNRYPNGLLLNFMSVLMHIGTLVNVYWIP